MNVPRAIVVVAAVIRRDGRFLVTRRPEGGHLPGLWEFPGGKTAPGESHSAALVREIREELDAPIDVHELILSATHEYDDRTVSLHFYRCTLLGEPRPALGQEMMWVAGRDLQSLEFPPADAELIERLAEE